MHQTKAFTTENIPDLTGKVAIVTGGNTGIGLQTVKDLARKNAKVYLAARSPARGQAALDAVKAEIPNANVVLMQLDLGDLRQVKAAAEAFVAGGEPLHILVNNAGIMMTPFELTKDGVETQFGTNHLGHFAFTTVLLPVIERSAPARIVNVSSDAFQWAKDGIQFDKINDESAATTSQRYGASKLANILFTKSLAERFEGKKVWVNVIHPGIVNTELLRGLDATYEQDSSWGSRVVGPVYKAARKLAANLLLSPEKGALTSLYAATSPEIEAKDFRGQYFVPFGKHESTLSAFSESKDLRDKLWAFSEKLIADKLAMP
ncbi:hypothetical protein BJ742DRAFT_427083 [Cladochytrium replicatum]|nr:hypothetical protein BJ742DRAFT_427083 [Cladochytrium replicatum]